MELSDERASNRAPDTNAQATSLLIPAFTAAMALDKQLERTPRLLALCLCTQSSRAS
jgi:hypothetical protein